jgi:very-short-patch-repair endonuclease
MVKKENRMFLNSPQHAFKHAQELRKHLTHAESLLWEKLRNRKLDGFKFRRQHPIHQFVANFYCAAANLVVEVDGGYHKENEQKNYDIGRTSELEDYGIKVIRFENKQIEENITEVLTEIKNYLFEQTKCL